jgi:toxin CptA
MSLPFFRVRPEEGGSFSCADTSIAVSAVVTPSRIFNIICLGMSGVLLAIAIALLDNAQSGQPIFMRVGFSGFAFFAAVVVFMQVMVSRPLVRIDIAGQGQIRLVLCREPVVALAAKTVVNHDGLLHLQPGTLIFSSLLLLRLKDDASRSSSLLIFPDCVSASAFRRLSVACRWIAIQNQRRS